MTLTTRDQIFNLITHGHLFRNVLAFGDPNNIPVNFGSSTPKTEILGRWIELLSVNDEK